MLNQNIEYLNTIPFCQNKISKTLYTTPEYLSNIKSNSDINNWKSDVDKRFLENIPK